ncbi:MAG: DUF4397 domain-containing protein [Gemmatimonadaceae bacterium]|nr:DUF4397 domain-containing protein [Gemmatimonadaceae bacterium]NUR21140.1 DUF4397 domain-containing protein [Gemmatimonadaceae bacterium]
MKNHYAAAVLLCAGALVGCGDKVDPIGPVRGPQPTSAVKYFNFSVGAPGVNFYANDTKVTAISSSTGVESTTGTTYGNAGAGALYTAIAPGQYTFTGRIAAATDKGLTIASTAQNIADGKRYSFYQSGIYNATTKTTDSFIVEDNWTIPTDTMAHVRFVNAISNAPNAIQLVIKSQSTGSTEITIGGPTAYKSATDFVAVPGSVYDLYARYPGSATNVFTRTSISLLGRRVATITARGDATSSATATKPTFDITINY